MAMIEFDCAEHKGWSGETPCPYCLQSKLEALQTEPTYRIRQQQAERIEELEGKLEEAEKAEAQYRALLDEERLRFTAQASRLDACQSSREWLQKQNTIEQDHSANLKRSLAVAYSILNDAMAEQDYHVDVSRTAVWLAANERVVEKPLLNPIEKCGYAGCARTAGHKGQHMDSGELAVYPETE